MTIHNQLQRFPAIKHFVYWKLLEIGGKYVENKVGKEKRSQMKESIQDDVRPSVCPSVKCWERNLLSEGTPMHPAKAE